MSKSNREIRIVLARMFGSGCMFKKSHAEEFIEKLGTIKTYKQFKKEKRYSSKKIKQLEQIKTLHHLQHKSENGRTCVENGAIINELAHRYIHSLPRNQEEIINNVISEWKKRNYIGCELEFIEDWEKPYTLDFVELVVSEDGIRPYNRAKEKEKTRKKIKEYYDETRDV